MEKLGPNKLDYLQNLFPKKLGTPSLSCWNFRSVTEGLLKHIERIEI